MSAPLRILLATYNGAPHLEEQLQSYLAQDHTNWALWVSDDGSTDGTWEILRAFQAAHPDREIRLIRGPGRGAAANFLSLITHPDLPPGPVALSDQDDVWMPHRLSRALDMLGRAQGPMLYGSTTIETDPDLNPLPRQKTTLPPPSFANAMVQNIVAGNTTTLNAPALAALRAGGAPDVPYHDWWIYLRLAGVGAQILLDDTPLLFYRQHAGNVIGAHSGMHARLQRATALLGGTYRGWVHTNLTALLAHGEDLLPEYAMAAQTLLNTRNRRTALHQSGAQRSGPKGQMILKGLAWVGRV